MQGWKEEEESFVDHGARWLGLFLSPGERGKVRETEREDDKNLEEAQKKKRRTQHTRPPFIYIYMNSSGLFQRDIFGRVLLLEGEISLLNLYIGKMCFSLFDIQRLSQKLSLAIHTCDSRSFTAKQKMLVSFFFFRCCPLSSSFQNMGGMIELSIPAEPFFPPSSDLSLS